MIRHLQSAAMARANLGERLKQGALANAQTALEIAEDWSPAEHETWQRLEKGRTGQEAFPQRLEIYITALDPALGHEIKKTRPALVIQNDLTNRFGMTTIVAAITSRVNIPPYPNEVFLQPNGTGLDVVSTVRLDQIRTVDRQRLRKRIGKLDASSMRRVDEALKISLGLLRY